MGDISKLVREKNKQRSALKKEYFKMLTNPFVEGGHVFDAGIQRHGSMRSTRIEHFREAPKNVLMMLGMIVLPIYATFWFFSNSRAKREAAIRSGQVSYRDRLFKYV